MGIADDKRREILEELNIDKIIDKKKDNNIVSNEDEVAEAALISHEYSDRYELSLSNDWRFILSFYFASLWIYFIPYHK